ncbi:hypothetical protein PQF33_19110 [Dactylosporangium aurantiacum]|nr:hypothetical protein [Dactylosporangium aurantiacum]
MKNLLNTVATWAFVTVKHGVPDSSKSCGVCIELLRGAAGCWQDSSAEADM